MPQPCLSNGDDYLETYRDGGIYDSLEYGSPYVSKGVKFARYACQSLRERQRVLCIGCGCGWEVIEYLNNGHDAYGTEVHDINVPVLAGRIFKGMVPGLPFRDKQFDIVHCTEVLEHIPESETDGFLREVKRIGSQFVFSIADDMDDFDTHCNLHRAGWWIDTFERNGYVIDTFQWKPTMYLVVGKVMQPLNYIHGYFLKCH